MVQTFFEMLGNWSFGDYFKKGAIEMSWELMTKVYGLDPSRLYITYFEGDLSSGLGPDLETKILWQEVGVAEDHILPGNLKDNFWEMGEQGPCGPCSEIHYDRIGGRIATSLVNKDDPNVLEIWNNVFIQFNRQQDGSLKPLPSKHVDTGMGFERLVSVLQDKLSNYDTDVFHPLFSKIKEITNARPYCDKYGKDDNDGIDTAYRVIADHIRLLTFAISDGAIPNNEGRGYVVRRVLRRGSRYARKYFNADIGNFFSRVLPALIEQMGNEFPQIREKQGIIAEILDEEEKAFSRTLDKGERIFEKYAAEAIKSKDKKLSGADVWRLYDTYGFPEDLTKIMAEERGLVTDDSEIRIAQEKAREASKNIKDTIQTFVKPDIHHIDQLKTTQTPPTIDGAKFLKGAIKGTIQNIFHNASFHSSTEKFLDTQPLGILLDRTNFYAEQGGQVFDTGSIFIEGVAEFNVLDVQVYGGYIFHNGFLSFGKLAVGDVVVCEYNEHRRDLIRKNHTGTHILNHSLREHLGDDVSQKGSLVDEDKLRFDFSHRAPVTISELQMIENSTSEYIKQKHRVYAKDVDLITAKSILGVRAVFDETYPNPVRVVSIGVDIDVLLKNPSNPEWRKTSIEFCGGTHVDQTDSIKELVIIEESGIARGTRRIVACTGRAAIEAQKKAKDFTKRIEQLKYMPLGPVKEMEAKAVQQDFNQLSISTIVKDRLKNNLTMIQKDILDEKKRKQKIEANEALETIHAHFACPENEDTKFYIGRLPNSTDLKTIIFVMNHFKHNEKDKTVCMISGSLAESVVTFGTYIGTVGFN